MSFKDEDDEISVLLLSIFADGMPSNGGTFFLQEYMIPRGGSASFCLCDTRGLSQISSSDNTTMIEQWIKKGVHHGEPVIWSFLPLSCFILFLALISFFFCVNMTSL